MVVAERRCFRTTVSEDDLTGYETVGLTGEPADEFCKPFRTAREPAEGLWRSRFDCLAHIVISEDPGCRRGIDDTRGNGVERYANSGPLGDRSDIAHPAVQRTLGGPVTSGRATGSRIIGQIRDRGSLVTVGAMDSLRLSQRARNMNLEAA